MYFAKLLRWDLLIYVRYKIVRFVAVRHFIPSVCVCVCVCVVFLTECNLVIIYVRYKIVRSVVVCHFIPSVCVSGVPY